MSSLSEPSAERDVLAGAGEIPAAATTPSFKAFNNPSRKQLRTAVWLTMQSAANRSPQQIPC
jgi:hypothetical protein